MNSQVMYLTEIDAVEKFVLVKKLIAAALATLVTVVLFLIMYSLIKNDSIPKEAPLPPIIPSVKFEEPEIETVIETTLPIKPVIENPPITPRIVEPIDTNIQPGLNVDPVVIVDPVKTVIPVFGGSQLLPIVKVAPIYPNQAATRGIVGYVDVVFNVTETGATENIKIVYAEPEKIFNSAVLKAVARWKYKPKMDGNTPEKVYGVRERIRFEL